MDIRKLVSAAALCAMAGTAFAQSSQSSNSATTPEGFVGYDTSAADANGGVQHQRSRAQVEDSLQRAQANGNQGPQGFLGYDTPMANANSSMTYDKTRAEVRSELAQTPATVENTPEGYFAFDYAMVDDVNNAARAQ